ncbi:MAG: hypothetical protein K8T25_01990 [Planctomycetia bacterium]|nr:hypothetical protein [Planctomycetia bacterium]
MIAHATPQDRPKVLIVLHPDGWVEAFADKSVDVRVVEVWGDNFAEGTADEQVERLPECYARLHLTGNLRSTGFPKFKSRPGDWIGAAIDRYVELLEAAK